MTAASQTITLPNPTIARYRGARVTFKRKTNVAGTNNTTIFILVTPCIGTFGNPGYVAPGGFVLFNSTIVPSTTLLNTATTLTLSVAVGVFQVDLVCDGVHWCVIGHT